MADTQRWLSKCFISLLLIFSLAGSALAAEIYRTWEEGRREEGIRMLKSQAAQSGQIAFYGYVRFSDKGTRDIGRITLEIAAENWYGEQAEGKFNDGSFYGYFNLHESDAAEITLNAVSLGYQNVEKKFPGRVGNTYDLGEIVLQKLDPADFTAGIKGKVFLPFMFNHSGIKVIAAHEGLLGRDSPYTTSAKDGSFELKGLPSGKYYIVFQHPLLTLKHPGRSVTLRKDEVLDLGNIAK
jgi:hypothetical protein